MPKKLPKSSRSIAIFFMLVNTVTWGAAIPIVKPLFPTLSPYEFLFWRYVFAALFSLPILFYYLPIISHKTKTILSIIFIELIGTTLALSLLYEGLARTSAIETSLIVTTTPIFITLGGIFFLNEKQDRHEWIGLAIALIGTLILTLEPLLTGRNGEATFSFMGNMLVFAQNIATTAYFLLAKKFYKNLPKLFVTTISFYVGIVSFFALSIISSGTLQTGLVISSYTLLFPILYMAVFGSIIGLTAYIKGQDGIEASEASLFTYLQPLVFIPLSVLWLGETVNVTMLFAVMIITVGVSVSEYRPKKVLQ